MNKEVYEKLIGYRLLEGRDNWRSLCPVHNEDTPSFFIHKDTYLCHCFGCGASGRLEKVLSRQIGKTERELRSLLEIPLLRNLKVDKVEVAENYFSKSWLSAFKLIKNHPYLERRGFTDATIMSHEARWDAKEKRIVFPLKDLEGNTIGATGRTVVEDYPKWNFYWGVEKGSTLYYSQFHPASRKIIIVEGICDVMWLNQIGMWNVVAILGSHPTKRQVELIKQIADTAQLFLDNDEGGHFAQKYLRNALKGSVDLRYAMYPTKHPSDPQMLTEEQVIGALEGNTYVEYTNVNR